MPDPKLDLAEVKKVSKLARLQMDDAELARAQTKLQTLLDFFQDLQQVPVEGIAPVFHGNHKMNLRPDVAEAPLPLEEVLRNAPEYLDSSFKLPRIVGGE